MNERQKILELVHEGKLTPEQADLLIEALEERTSENAKSTRPWDAKVSDIKQLSTQLTSYVSQSLADVKRTVEQELRGLSNFSWSATLTATTELDLREGMKELFVETKNGRVGLAYWDKPYVRVLVRGQVRANDLDEATKQLQASLQASESGDRWHMTVRHDTKEGVVGADIDLMLPSGLDEVSIRTHNGAIRADSVDSGILRLVTNNGAIFVYRANVSQLHLNSDNGAIDIHRSLTKRTERVYVTTKNGTIDIEGVPADVAVSGAAKSELGRVSVTSAFVNAEYVDPPRNTYAKLAGVGGERELLIHCETKNGAIHLRD